MSGGLTSLESAIRTCKVNTGNADRIQSDRFLGFPDKKTCPPFLGTDLTGRAVCPDSFMTKSAGCNTPEDRIYIENTVSRPHYYEYINLSPRGMLDDETIEGFGFGQQESSFIREGYEGNGKMVTYGGGACNSGGCGVGYGVPKSWTYGRQEVAAAEADPSFDDLPGDLRFNATQAGPFNNMPLWAFSVVPREYGMPYSQLYGQNAEDQRLKQALWARAEIMGQDPIVPGPSRYGYRMMGDY
ncbi:hypothetical protein IIV31_009L [Armadillidium vulgare iridescent virus]|uniref:Uncharacterized protein n=1 Tax=Armadillidium vulgare iridescent virus TaxID=72201 RepID=A0A068QK99_9VIRU|nr:hypothetical protein IIV31_009L [Armadillidium vulgare iridescent virus]CCV02381.1 hypothetical protein IIV31_009L [Armadillidium vulgare iridescent virus]